MNRYVRPILSLVFIFVLFVQPVNHNYVQAAMNVDEYFDQKQNEQQKEENNESHSPVEQGQEQELQADSGSLMGNLMKMVFMLLIVLALIYFLLKFLQKRNKMFQQVQALENLGGISLGSNKSVQMVRIADRIYVIGVGEDISMLTEIEDEETKEELLKEDQEANTNQPFKAMLKSLEQRKEQHSDKESDTNSFKEQFNSELKKLKNGRQKLMKNSRDTGKEDQDG
ncbi:flagellar protein [Virgibacillus sp. MSP4-1]|uniref:flagellar biosynthetic protein FliO n=1 Tax=Virgibacillus sp. MSP4-1 TaxID=2700081 RepID=UPI00039C932C|nr:flagellar biosynthetic protein FliO [Virgibacillus sp. MSP4-1]QHS22259.1 flagellar protein [Virgibacillus sp. MSP4-1]